MTKPKPLRFALLCRVSTRDQDTLESQEADGRAYAKRAGGAVVKVYSKQESATKEDRPVLDRALRDAEAGAFDVLVVRDTSRLSRHVGTMLAAMSRLHKARVALHDFRGPIDIETPEGEFVMTVTTGANRMAARKNKNDSLNERVKRMESGVPAAGRPPYGRKWTGEQFTIVPERQAQITKVYDAVCRRGRSFNAAAEEAGIPRSSLRKAIASAAQSEVVQHLNGNAYRFPCPPLLSEPMQRRLAAKVRANAVARPETPGEYLLQGLVRCQSCGRTMTGMTSTKGAKRYSVYRHAVHGDAYKPGCCWQVPRDMIDALVLDYCARMVRDGEALRERIAARLRAEQSGADDLHERRRELRRDIAAAERTMDAALEEIGKLASETAKRELRRRLDKLGARLDALRAEEADAATKLEAIAMPAASADHIAAQIRALYWGAAGQSKRFVASRLPFAKRREFVRAIVGREGRESEQGIFVRMERGKSKKDVRWTFVLNGAIAPSEERLAGIASDAGVKRRAKWTYPARFKAAVPVRVDGEIER